jgi:hypothetical protein
VPSYGFKNGIGVENYCSPKIIYLIPTEQSISCQALGMQILRHSPMRQPPIRG